MYDLAIQIVNYKTKAYLAECLAGLVNDLKDSKLKCNINVLDNDSGDDLSDLKSQYSDVSFYDNDINSGYGGGHNILAKKAEAGYMLLLNPDIKFVELKTIERLFNRIDQDKNIKVIGPRLMTAKGDIQWWDHGELHGLIAKIALKSGNSYWKIQNKVSSVAWISGAAFLIDKKIFDQLGGFDEHFFLYKEEEELCWRVREQGGKVIYDPTVKLLHVGGVVAKKTDHMQKSVDFF